MLRSAATVQLGKESLLMPQPTTRTASTSLRRPEMIRTHRGPKMPLARPFQVRLIKA